MKYFTGENIPIYGTFMMYACIVVLLPTLLPTNTAAYYITHVYTYFLSLSHTLILDGLFELLMQMVAETVRPENQLVMELSSVASACLLSLVVALGDTSKMLSALTAMLTAPGDLTVQVCGVE